jgi:hypothetical protein
VEFSEDNHLNWFDYVLWLTKLFDVQMHFLGYHRKERDTQAHCDHINFHNRLTHRISFKVCTFQNHRLHRMAGHHALHFDYSSC